MILCNKNFAHDIVQFKNPRKDINEIAFITRTFICFRMFLNEFNKNLIKIYLWWKYGKNQCDVDFCFDEDKILTAIRREQKNFDLVISEEKSLFTSDVTLLHRSQEEKDVKKFNQIISVRTSPNFYLFLIWFSFTYKVTIRYLIDETPHGNKKIRY